MPPLHCTNPSSPARLFIQLSMRRQAIATSHPLLDLLLPLPVRSAASPATRAHRSLSSTTRSPQIPRQPAHSQTTATNPRPWRPTHHHPLRRHTTRRAFTTSTPRFAAAAAAAPSGGTTRAIFNPQTDEDGQEMMLEITPRAAKRLSEIMTKDSNPYLALRIQVESGGCHGFQYLMKLVTLPPSLPSPTESSGSSSIEDDGSAIGEDDTIFTYAADGEDGTADLEAPKIILDAPSLELLKGSKVDFTMELIGSQFKIVDNPLATSSCGCGTSFDIKV
ncbi:putative iron sulfur assembly protein [Triangularia verruculosa]|uniref:Iron sulfur assembly protein n=1 Tax=Triangularia verruculosa TaxID=2587418 RepID=A0AAN6XH54_9PEZI|nr:putative iron sulfur assembly protein [Triangularia verruculosa]